uniref:RNA polymerase subunit beta n=1 Tax=Pithovirus LCPAC401 TaxID=2506595 RepID=A0A481ZA28_9VIRU|nr:MAG: RNA polymerase subunit beta [Pithovirus LCPAC401]
MNRAPIERGLFMMSTYHVYKSVIRSPSDEKFTIPFCQEEKYHAIDEDGIPRMDSCMIAGDCIIGKVRIDTGNIIDVSTYVKSGEQGTVDEVNVSKGDNITVVIVRIKRVGIPQTGDMFASHYAQIACGIRPLPEGDGPW